MLSRLNTCMFSLLLLLIFTSTSVYGVTCKVYEKSCSSYSYTWCCSSSQYCGSYEGACDYYTTRSTPSSDFPTALITVIILVPIFFCVICFSCCIQSKHQQRSRSSVITRNPQILPHPYQQQSIRGPVQVVRVRPVYNVSIPPPVRNVYEGPPPSYEASVATFQPKYISPPVTDTTEQTNLRV